MRCKLNVLCIRSDICLVLKIVFFECEHMFKFSGFFMLCVWMSWVAAAAAAALAIDDGKYITTNHYILWT